MQEQITELRSPIFLACVRKEQMRSLILELGRQRRTLSCDIETEEARAGINDASNYAYSPLAKALRERRDRLEHSITTLTERLENFDGVSAW